MTAVTTTPVETVAEPRARFRDLEAAEWLKFWSLRSTPGTFVISALVILGLNAGMAYEHVHYWHANRSVAATFIADGLPLLDAFTSNAAIAMIVAAGAIGTLAVTGEYGTGLIRTTFSAVPARRSVMAAKVSVIAVVTTVFNPVARAYPWTITGAWTVFAVWGLAAAVLAVAAVQRRDV